jgi:hypothetical protein
LASATPSLTISGWSAWGAGRHGEVLLGVEQPRHGHDGGAVLPVEQVVDPPAADGRSAGRGLPSRWPDVAGLRVQPLSQA